MKQFKPLIQINTMTKTPETKVFHHVHNSYDGIVNTISGRKIDLRNPTEDSIDINDIANSLSKLCRFNGQTNRFYSVAQHSVLVSKLVEPEYAREALMHDSPEAYIGDVTSPLKYLLGSAYTSLERNFELVIAHKFNLRQSAQIKAAIKVADMKALELEHECFQKNNVQPFMDAMHKFDPKLSHPNYDSGYARTIFLGAFEQLFG